MKKKYGLSLLIMMIIITVLFCGCSNDKEQPSDPSAISTDSGKVIISFDFTKQSGHASNQFAVWIENSSGELVRTLYATEFTPEGGFEKRPDAIATWVEKAQVANMSDEEVDAISGATPKSGSLSYGWDLTDENGELVPEGEYKFFVEGSLRWKNRVIFTDNIIVGDEAMEAIPKAEFIFEGNDDSPALSESAEEASMIQNVKAEFSPKK